MRPALPLIILGLAVSVALCASAQNVMPSSSPSDGTPQSVEVTADQSLEWYQDQKLYVARGNAKAVRGEMVVQADLLTAHQRDKAPDGKPAKPAKNASTGADTSAGTGDLDRMTAEGNVRVTDPKQRILGDHALYDLDKHSIIVTGDHLRYETEKETVTARDSLEYYEDKKIAVARGDAKADETDRHVQADVLTAEFHDGPNGSSELTKMTGLGHVVIVTKEDVSRGDKTVYDMARDIAILTGNVRITRSDGTELTGDVGEVDLKTNQSRLLNDGHGRVRALLASSPSQQAKTKPAAVPYQAKEAAEP